MKHRDLRRWLRILIAVTSVAIVVGAFFVVPMPLASFAPGDATAVDELLRIDGTTAAVDGELRLLSVYVAQPSMFGVVRGRLDANIDLLPREDVFPTNVRRVDFQESQRETFRTALRISAAVGLREAGYDVKIVTAASVAAVVDDGPASGILLPGDIVLALDGTPVASSRELVEAAGTSVAGQVLSLDLERNGRPLTVSITAAVLPNTEQVGIGIAVETLDRDLELPLDVELVDQRSIGGPSAGLMVALAIYDLVSDENLTAGRNIAGTGTLDGEGNVGRIGGIREKTIAAIEDGVELLLVPESQAADARDAAAGRVRVVGVATFEDALAALR